MDDRIGGLRDRGASTVIRLRDAAMKRAFLILGIAVAVVALVAVSAVLVVVAIRGVSSREPTQAEKEMLVQASRLADYGADNLNPTLCETFKAKTNLDGSLELEYEYDSDRDPKSKQSLFFKSEAEINRSVRDARESYFMQIAAYKAGALLVKGRSIQESPELLSLGEQNFSALIMQDGKPLGNVVVIRQAATVHSLLTIGLYFDEADDLRSLLRGVMEKSKKPG